MLPRGCSIIEYERKGERFRYKASCRCDWAGFTFDTREQAVAEAVEHARDSAWCYVHRNLTPIGADPVMGEVAPG